MRLLAFVACCCVILCCVVNSYSISRLTSPKNEETAPTVEGGETAPTAEGEETVSTVESEEIASTVESEKPVAAPESEKTADLGPVASEILNVIHFPFESGKAAGERCVAITSGAEFAFRWVPAGTFTMGSPEDEEERDSYETQHEVTLTKGFWILETETTQAMWQGVMGENPSKWQGENKPVDSVGLDEIDVFCAKWREAANAPEGVVVQLTTEAQWEYAARAGSADMYGGKSIDEVAWYGDENGGGTHDVGTKEPNAWGIFDMVGNLWEWCSDRYDAYATDDEGKGVAVVDPTGATLEQCPGDVRVDRGGCWDSKPYECRVANRGFYDHDRKGPYVGFRFVVIPE